MAKTKRPERHIEDRIKRGRERLNQREAGIRENIEFANGNHYAYVNERGQLQRLSTVAVSQGGEKPDHRVRLSRPLIRPMLKAKVSATTQRAPDYESVPTSYDREDEAGAKMAEKIATAGYSLWDLRRIHQKWVWNALVTKEGFARAYWNPNVGPYIEIDEMQDAEVPVTDPETGEPTGVMETTKVPSGKTRTVGMGECAVRVYTGLEVTWEPGVDFEESRWYYIEHARPVDEVKKEPGFIGDELEPDAKATTEGRPRESKSGEKLAMIGEYLERPCPEYPNGRRIILAGGEEIFPEEPYPCRDHENNVIDEPCLHRLFWDIDGSSDRAKGLVEALIDLQREFDIAGNKVEEFAQAMLLPQWVAEEGTITSPMTDEPNAVIEYRTLPGQQPPKPREIGNVPSELFEIQDRASATMRQIAHDGEIPSGVRDSGAIQTIVQQNQVAWQDFVEAFAEGASRLMRDLLILVQRHYTEDRLVKFRGRTGWENIADFRGADIRGQTDIRVNPSSLQPRTRQQIEQRIMNIAQMFPGQFPPEVLISAMEGGSAEKLIEGYEDDLSRANRIISLIRTGEFWSEPKRPVFPGEEAPKINPLTGLPEIEETGEMEPVFDIDPATGEQVQAGERPQLKPVMETELPGWMPRPFDNVPVQKAVLTTWMKTDDWAKLEEAKQRATMQVYSAMVEIEQRNSEMQAGVQSGMAEEAGMLNATKSPQKPLPSLPSLNGSGEEEPA